VLVPGPYLDVSVQGGMVSSVISCVVIATLLPVQVGQATGDVDHDLQPAARELHASADLSSDALSLPSALTSEAASGGRRGQRLGPCHAAGR
jgi:hypothetical protein